MKTLMRSLVRDKTIPYHHTPQKNFEPISTAGFLAGTLGSSVLGGLFGLFGGDNTNETNWNIAKLNYQLQQETNKLNFRANAANNLMNQMIAREYNANQLQLNQQMNDFNHQMWQENNAYNSPANQLKLAEAAGLNPNMAFGITPASSPVQQTSIPSQQMAQMNSYRADSPKLDYQKQYSALKELGKLLEALPQNALSLESSRLDNQRKRIENDIRNEELDSMRNEKNIYKSLGLIQNVDNPNDLITPDEYDSLSDEAKMKYQIKDSSGSSLPNVYVSGFRSRGAFEAWKDVRNLPNFLQNISADRSQAKLRQLVADKQIKNDKVINGIVNMPAYEYNNLIETYKKLKAENDWNSETHDVRKEILSLNKQQLENAVNSNLQTYLEKMEKGDMSWTDWLKMALVVAATFK